MACWKSFDEAALLKPLSGRWGFMIGYKLLKVRDGKLYPLYVDTGT